MLKILKSLRILFWKKEKFWLQMNPRGNDILAACGQLKSLKKVNCRLGNIMKKAVLAYSGGLDTSITIEVVKKLPL